MFVNLFLFTMFYKIENIIKLAIIRPTIIIDDDLLDLDILISAYQLFELDQQQTNAFVKLIIQQSLSTLNDIY